MNTIKTYEEKNQRISSNLLNDINMLLCGKYDRSQDIKLRENTPKQLIDNGVKDLPMLMNSNHLLDNILTKDDAKKLGLYKRNKNYHGLGVLKFLQVVSSLDNPIAIYKWCDKDGKKYTENDYVVLTKEKIGKNNIIVPIYIETKGNYNYARLDTNKVKTVYPKENIVQKLKRRVENGEMIEIYNKKRISHCNQYRCNG